MNREQFGRLPKYARYEIQRLRADIEGYRKQREEIDAGESDTKVAYYNENDVYLPSGSRVVFYSDGGVVEVMVKRYGRGQNENGYTVVEATSGDGLGHGLTILPLSSNLVQLGTVH